MQRSIRFIALSCLAAACSAGLSGCQAEQGSEESSRSASAALEEGEPALKEVAAALTPQIDQLGQQYGFDANDSWKLRDAPMLDEFGRVIARFDRFHAGLEVVGGDVIVHAELKKDLPLFRFVSRLSAPLTMSLQPVLSESDAKDAAQQLHPKADAESAELLIWAVDEQRSNPRLAWLVRIGSFRVAIDASDGSMLDEYTTLQTAECGDGLTCSAHSISLGTLYAPGVASWTGVKRTAPGGSTDYALENLERKIRVADSSITRAEAPGLGFAAFVFGLDVDFTQGSTMANSVASIGNSHLFDGNDAESSPDRRTPAADVFANLTRTYDFYASKFGRYSFNGTSTVCLNPITWDFYPCLLGAEPIRVAANIPLLNAAFDSERRKLWFGYDSAVAYDSWGPLVELDIVTHEFTHAVTRSTAALVYNFSHSGSLNESMSDVFGRVSQFHYDPASFYSSTAWWIARRAATSAWPDDIALRYMDDPTRDGVSIAHFSDFPAAGIDPHRGSGIPNFAFTLAAQWIGWEPAARIWYRALTTCFTASTTFHDARVCTADAAQDLYPTTSPDNDTAGWVRNAWNVVGVY